MVNTSKSRRGEDGRFAFRSQAINTSNEVLTFPPVRIASVRVKNFLQVRNPVSAKVRFETSCKLKSALQLVAMTTALTPEQIQLSVERTQTNNRLEHNEQQMSKAAGVVAECLKDIHKNKLWRFKYSSFEDYCLKYLGISQRRAYQILEADSTRLVLADAAAGDPEISEVVAGLNNRQVAELKDLDPDDAITVVKKAASSAPKTKLGKPALTSGGLAKARSVVIDAEEEPEPPSAPRVCPTCKRPMK